MKKQYTKQYIQEAINYWKKQLKDLKESQNLGDRSYWSIWLKEYPQYKPNSPEIRRYLAKLFDERMSRIDNLEDKLEKYVKIYDMLSDLIPYERNKAALLGSFGPEITDRNFFWEPIPARTYKAIISRNRARSQGQITTEASSSVLKDCLDSICRAAAIITTHSSGYSLNDSINALNLSNTHTAKILYNLGCKDNEYVNNLYIAVSAFCTAQNEKAMTTVTNKFEQKYGDEMWGDEYYEEYRKAIDDAIRVHGAGDWLTNSSDGQIGEEIEDIMRSQPYDVYETPEVAVPLISRLVDKAHIRGDIAGAFVEGGAPTCAEVSNMKPDELYESKNNDKQIHYWAHMLDSAMNLK